jgi:hypothetical protein
MRTSCSRIVCAILAGLRVRLSRIYVQILIFAVLPLTLACGSFAVSQHDIEQAGWNNFRTAVASDRNYDIYWLGREFDAGGQTFRGPEVPDGGIADIEGGGLTTLYDGDIGELSITLYSRAAWDLALESRARGVQPTLMKEQVDVHGWPAELETNYYRPGYTAARILVVDLGRTVIEAASGSVVPRTPGPEPNPLIDKETFLSVLQNLRPYPQ